MHLFIYDYSIHFCSVGLCFSLVYEGDVACLGTSDRCKERTFNLSHLSEEATHEKIYAVLENT